MPKQTITGGPPSAESTWSIPDSVRWWAYRQTYHGHVRDELVCRSLKERSLASNVLLLVNDIDDLREAWNTLDTCFDRPEKYISEALDPVVKFSGVTRRSITGQF
jgi:hypothetical protein